MRAQRAPRERPGLPSSTTPRRRCGPPGIKMLARRTGRRRRRGPDTRPHSTPPPGPAPAGGRPDRLADRLSSPCHLPGRSDRVRRTRRGKRSRTAKPRPPGQPSPPARAWRGQVRRAPGIPLAMPFRRAVLGGLPPRCRRSKPFLRPAARAPGRSARDQGAYLVGRQPDPATARPPRGGRCLPALRDQAPQAPREGQARPAPAERSAPTRRSSGPGTI